MASADRLTISQLARAAKVPTTTVRYYERVGLLRPEDRSQGNYRLYDQQSLRRLRFIRTAQASGFTLDIVRLLLGSAGGTAPSCARVRAMIEDHLAEVEGRLKDLRKIRRVLRSSLQKCRDAGAAACCHVIDSL
jgi:MerR family mercuric resistance operon transcriptional regulator